VQIPTSGKLSAAGSYAPQLHDEGFFADSYLVVCPGSTLAKNASYRIPTAEEILATNGANLAEMRRLMGGSYGYHIGHIENGHLERTRNRGSAYFALMADAPSARLANYQSENHGGVGQNVLFEDGHVVFMTTCGVNGASFYVNDDGMIEPGLNADDSVIAASAVVPVVFLSTGH
jgi:hypothetical protein